MYVVTHNTIRDLLLNGELHIGCSLTTLYRIRNDLNDYFKFQNKEWRATVDSKKHCLRAVRGEEVVSNNIALLVEELALSGSVVYKPCSTRNLRRVAKEVNEYLETNNFSVRVKANYKENSIEVIV